MVNVVNRELKYKDTDDKMAYMFLLAKGVREHFSQVQNVLDLTGQVNFIIYSSYLIGHKAYNHVKMGESEVNPICHYFHFLAMVAGILNSIITFFRLF